MTNILLCGFDKNVYGRIFYKSNVILMMVEIPNTNKIKQNNKKTHLHNC